VVLAAVVVARVPVARRAESRYADLEIR
jgi:hypothetical protein